jgi:hypothetical protein
MRSPHAMLAVELVHSLHFFSFKPIDFVSVAAIANFTP